MRYDLCHNDDAKKKKKKKKKDIKKASYISFQVFTSAAIHRVDTLHVTTLELNAIGVENCLMFFIV